MELHERIVKAGEEIAAICKKYNVSLIPKYDEGIAVLIHGGEFSNGYTDFKTEEIEINT